MDDIPRLLKAFVIGGGILLVVGMVTLVVLLAQRAGDHGAEDLAERPVAAGSIALPAGMIVEQMTLDGQRLVLLGTDAAGRQQLIVVDPESGERLGVLELRPEE